MSSSTTWLGVEWDHASRGKHSGTHQGISYFRTREEGAGSFIKLPMSSQKGKQVLRPGTTLWHAIVQRYLPDDDEQDDRPITLGSSGGAIKVEVPRLDRVKRSLSGLSKLKEIGVERTWVSELGEAPSGVVLQCGLNHWPKWELSADSNGNTFDNSSSVP
jgi:hypothetical protein